MGLNGGFEMRFGLMLAGAGACLALVSCGNGTDTAQTASTPTPEPVAPSGPTFGETATERTSREAAEAKAGLGDYWVKTDVATEHASPGGAVVNRVYYGQKFTVYEKRGEWYRTVEDGYTARWTRASQMTDSQLPEKPKYEGPAELRDDRIAADAIANPGEYGLTRADVDIIRKGAKLVLQSRPDCAEVVDSDKSISRANTYYVTCRVGGSVENVFFTRAEALAAKVQ